MGIFKILQLGQIIFFQRTDGPETLNKKCNLTILVKCSLFNFTQCSSKRKGTSKSLKGVEHCVNFRIDHNVIIAVSYRV